MTDTPVSVLIDGCIIKPEKVAPEGVLLAEKETINKIELFKKNRIAECKCRFS